MSSNQPINIYPTHAEKRHNNTIKHRYTHALHTVESRVYRNRKQTPLQHSWHRRKARNPPTWCCATPNLRRFPRLLARFKKRVRLRRRRRVDWRTEILAQSEAPSICSRTATFPHRAYIFARKLLSYMQHTAYTRILIVLMYSTCGQATTHVPRVFIIEHAGKGVIEYGQV